MPPIRRSVNGYLNEAAQFIPVDRQTKPNLLEAQGSILQPVLNFRPSPLVDELLSVDVFALSTTLVVAQNSITWSSLAVPREEVHRYVALYVSHNHAGDREFRLATRGQRGSGVVIFFSGIDVRHNISTGQRVNMLCDQPTTTVGVCNKTNNVLDLYPGMSFQIDNSENLDLLSVVTIQGYRLRMRGPVADGGVDVSADISATPS